MFICMKDLPHWSSSTAFPPNSYVPTVFLPPLNQKNKQNDLSNPFNNESMTSFMAKHRSVSSLNREPFDEHKGKTALKTDNYWNDWFGKPGYGAPIYTSYKQNLEYSLEPKRNRDHENQEFKAKYTSDMRLFGSNHHNYYQINK